MWLASCPTWFLTGKCVKPKLFHTQRARCQPCRAALLPGPKPARTSDGQGSKGSPRNIDSMEKEKAFCFHRLKTHRPPYSLPFPVSLLEEIQTSQRHSLAPFEEAHILKLERRSTHVRCQSRRRHLHKRGSPQGPAS